MGATLCCTEQASHCGGFSCCNRAQAPGHVGFSSCGTMGSVVEVLGLQSTSSAVVVHRLSCLVVCGSFPDQGLNLCLLDWQADSLPLDHQGSPLFWVLKNEYLLINQIEALMKSVPSSGNTMPRGPAGGTSLAVQWLRLCTPLKRWEVQSLVRELRFCMLRSVAKKRKKPRKEISDNVGQDQASPS